MEQIPNPGHPMVAEAGPLVQGAPGRWEPEPANIMLPASGPPSPPAMNPEFIPGPNQGAGVALNFANHHFQPMTEMEVDGPVQATTSSMERIRMMTSEG